MEVCGFVEGAELFLPIFRWVVPFVSTSLISVGKPPFLFAAYCFLPSAYFCA
jgi:hypothetical protein